MDWLMANNLPQWLSGWSLAIGWVFGMFMGTALGVILTCLVTMASEDRPHGG